MTTDYDICFVTVGDKKTADAITLGLLQEKLAACVSAVPGVESSYWWKDKLERSAEILLIIKTRRTLREDIIQFVKRHHPYAVPETVFTQIEGGSKEYLDWLGANTRFTTNIPLDKLPEGKK
ncbi:MAG TPA: divalent-cation tolerance protein CutA [Elusimicrobiales bacterium]|nr:divalent-cation tolerance protein CutA [Elusimicrobiales bacterium]